MRTSVGDSSDGDGAGTNERSVLLDLLFDHRADIIRNFLREREKPVSGTKQQLRERMEEYLGDGEVQQADLIDLLDTVEGWGNQHIFLSRAPANSLVLSQYANEESARAILQRHGLEHLFNRRRQLVMPVTPQLASVEWSPNRLRFIWVERRIWRERRPDLDRREDNDETVEFDAYQRHRGRGLVTFELDLVSGQAALFIQQLPSGNDYESVRGRFYEQLQPLLDVQTFNHVRVGRSIIHLERLTGVRRRQIEHATDRGSCIRYVSSERGVDAFSDPSLNRARNAAGDRVVGRLGNFYWQVDEEGREIHVKVYASDQRIGIFGECSEEEVRHVLRSIRQNSR